ncbi:site-specific DNA-methyltransferase [bacterium]|nr:site-specific DNA-methyltransferase [bacterium]
MDKLKMQSPDLTQDNIAKIRDLFPGCVTEATGEDGKLCLAVDFDQLRQELSDSIVDGPQERYHLNWPGKREALITANAPIAKTLRPAREESVDFDTTQNLFIEGDNLEALKLLQETYLGKVKMIYIDPPYNTGRDFVYDDNFSESTAVFLERSNQMDEANNRLVANTASNGRFHSDWLSMIFPRLKLAKNLLADDGVLFVSIDDEEYANMEKLCGEIFGQENYVETFVWVKKTAPNNVVIGSVHEYILVFAKNIQALQLYLLPRDVEKDKNYKNPDNDPRGRWKPDNLTAAAKGGRSTPTLIYEITNPTTGQKFSPPEGRMWAVNEANMLQKIADGTVYWGKNGDGRPMDKRFLSDTRQGSVAATLLTTVGTNSSASKELQALFNGQVVFETPKPTSLIKHLASIATKNEDVALDFFAGSGVLAESIMSLNAKDGLSRKSVSVQLPEAISDETDAGKLGYTTIAEISKERIRRAGQKIFQGECHPDWNKDVGFRVLKIDSSNMTDVFYTPDATNQADLLANVDSIKQGRTAEDLLFQVLVDWGVDLTLPIRRENIQGKTVFFVDENALVACFDTGVTEELVKELAGHEPLRVVFRDTGFVSDAVKINVQQIFKQLSPMTDVKAI